jgi:hypothetical protein
MCCCAPTLTRTAPAKIGVYYDVLEKPPHGERELVEMLRTGAFGAHKGR